MLVSKLPNGIHIIDSSKNLFKGDILCPFAIDEIWARKVGLGQALPGIHLWRHEKAFVLGLRDRKLPHALEAMSWLEQQGYAVTVRNSGGAAVPLDPGVVNMSIILPNPLGKIDFHEDFELMYQLIRESLGPLVMKGEVVGSYCPGDFDLSINGKKFCGIAQRRQTKAFVVQAFIVVEGKGHERAELVRQFYEKASEGMDQISYPQVTEESMASLQELAGIQSVDSYLEGLIAVLNACGVVPSSGEMLDEWMPEIQFMVDQLRDRYEKRGERGGSE